jgi:hypothetical protein
MQGQRAAGRIAFSAHRAVWRAAGALSGGNRDRPGLSVGAFHGDVYLHGEPFVDLMPVRICAGEDNVRHCLALVKDYFIGTNPNELWALWASVWVRCGQVWTRGQRVILPMKNRVCGQCGQCVLMSVNLKMYVILSNYTVGVWLTNAHTPRFRQRLKKGCPHCPHDPPLKYYMAKIPHAQRATGSCGHCPHCPPPKYYTVRFCKVCKYCKVCKLHGRWPIAVCLRAPG